MRSQVAFFIMSTSKFTEDNLKNLAAALVNMEDAKVFLVSSIHPGLRADLSLTCYL